MCPLARPPWRLQYVPWFQGFFALVVLVVLAVLVIFDAEFFFEFDVEFSSSYLKQLKLLG